MGEWRKYLYLTRADALAFGLTHEGTLFGLPVYLGDVTNPDEFLAVPKIPVLVLWTLFCSKAFELMSYFISEDTVVKTPMVLGDPL
jgi:hypothetical protein